MGAGAYESVTTVCSVTVMAFGVEISAPLLLSSTEIVRGVADAVVVVRRVLMLTAVWVFVGCGASLTSIV